METALLRLIYQRRFKLMNRWSAEAMHLQPKFGAVGDPVFRSFIFRAFDELLQRLRLEEKAEDAGGSPLLDQIPFPVLPDWTAYREVWKTGGAVLEEFCREDARCQKKFSREQREAAGGSVKEAVQAILERETRAHKRLRGQRQAERVVCFHCGRPRG